jgi:hypothetical protein
MAPYQGQNMRPTVLHPVPDAPGVEDVKKEKRL